MQAVRSFRMIAPVSVFLMLAALLFSPAPAAAQLTDSDAKGALAFITDLGTTAITALTKKGLSKADREQAFGELFSANFDVPRIGQFVLGKFWRGATKAEQKEFLNLFEAYVISAYANRFKDYSGEKFEINDASVKRRDIWVESRILRTEAGAPPVRIRWRVRPNQKMSQGYAIIDVVVEGISMGISQRDEFASVIQRGGGKVSALNKLLKQRLGGN